jgi:hypothetical protein
MLKNVNNGHEINICPSRHSNRTVLVSQPITTPPSQSSISLQLITLQLMRLQCRILTLRDYKVRCSRCNQ